MSLHTPKVIAVSLNPSVDRGIEVPGFAIGAHQVGRQLFRRPAGKAVNLAHALGTLDVPPLLSGFIGKGQQGYFERDLTHERVACQLFPVRGRTRENITIFDPVNKLETHIRDRGFEVTSADVDRLRKELAVQCRKGMYVVFSGSLPPGLAVEDFIELAQICQMNGANVCVDASGAVLRACRPLGLWLIKPNNDELAEMLEKPAQNDSEIIAAGSELRKSVGLTLVTVGKEGAFLFSESICLRGRVSVDPSEVKNTVGCGDAMLAGFVAGITSGKDIKESLAYSLATATASAVSLTPSGIAKSDITRFLARAEISELQLPAVH